jgi:uncharacterized protein
MSADSDDPKVSSFTARLVDAIVDRPLLALVLGLAVVAASVAGAPRLEADFTHRGFFWHDDPKLLQFEAFERRFGNDDAIVLAIHSPSGVFDLETATLLKDLTERMWQVPEVIRVDSLANYNWVHAEDDDIQVEPLLPDELTPEILAARQQVALADEVLPDYLVSRDGRTALLFARIKPGLDGPSDAPKITAAVRALLAELQTGDHSFHLTGGPPMTNAFKDVAERDLARLLPLAILIAAVALLVILRSVAGVVLPLVLMLLSVAAVFGFAGWTGITLTNMSTAVPSIMLAACIGDAVHILVGYYQGRRHGLDRKAATRRSLRKNFLPTILTSFTTSLGFVSFATANLKPVAGLGFMIGFGALLAWLLTYLVLGPLLVLVPVRAGRVDTTAAARDRRVAGRILGALVRRRVAVVVGSVLLTAGAIALATSNDINSDPFKYFDDDVDVRAANEFIEATVGGARGVELVIESGVEDGIKDPAFLRKVEALQAWIQQQPGVTRAVSLVDVLKSTHRSLNGDRPEAYALADDRETIAQELFLYTMSLPQGMDLNDRVTLRNDALRMTVLWTIAMSSEVVDTARAIEARAGELGLTVQVTGKYHLWNSMNEYVVRSFLWSFLLALVTISLTLAIALRSIKLALLSMLPNVVPILFGGAFLKVLGQPLDLGTVLVASVCLGIAVDDTIHVLANYRRFRQDGQPPFDAMREVFAVSGRPLLVTTTILVLSFGAFLTGDFIPNVYFGVLTALVLTVALVTDLVLLPVILLWRDSRAAGQLEPASRPTADEPALSAAVSRRP